MKLPSKTALCVIMLCVAASSLAPSTVVKAKGSTAWSAQVHLSVFSHGKWINTNNVDSLGLLKVDLTLKGQGAQSRGVVSRAAFQHLSWQGFTKVVMPPSFSVDLKRLSASRFEAVVQIPTKLPVYWSVLNITATDRHSSVETQSGIMVGGPAHRTRDNTLTIPQTFGFCANKPALDYLRYAIYLHGYYVPTPNGGDGPPFGITLDRPRKTPHNIRNLRNYPHGLPTGGFGPSGWSTSPGMLECDEGRPSGFGRLFPDYPQ